MLEELSIKQMLAKKQNWKGRERKHIEIDEKRAEMLCKAGERKRQKPLNEITEEFTQVSGSRLQLLKQAV